MAHPTPLPPPPPVPQAVLQLIGSAGADTMQWMNQAVATTSVFDCPHPLHDAMGVLMEKVMGAVRFVGHGDPHGVRLKPGSLLVAPPHVDALASAWVRAQLRSVVLPRGLDPASDGALALRVLATAVYVSRICSVLRMPYVRALLDAMGQRDAVDLLLDPEHHLPRAGDTGPWAWPALTPGFGYGVLDDRTARPVDWVRSMRAACNAGLAAMCVLLTPPCDRTKTCHSYLTLRLLTESGDVAVLPAAYLLGTPGLARALDTVGALLASDEVAQLASSGVPAAPRPLPARLLHNVKSSVQELGLHLRLPDDDVIDVMEGSAADCEGPSALPLEELAHIRACLDDDSYETVAIELSRDPPQAAETLMEQWAEPVIKSDVSQGYNGDAVASELRTMPPRLRFSLLQFLLHPLTKMARDAMPTYDLASGLVSDDDVCCPAPLAMSDDSYKAFIGGRMYNDDLYSILAEIDRSGALRVEGGGELGGAGSVGGLGLGLGFDHGELERLLSAEGGGEGL